MSHPRAFVSFDFDNNKLHRDLFVGQARNSRTPFNIQDWSSKQHLPQREWEALINDKINKCHMMIVLVGNTTYKSVGVAKEIQFAIANRIPFFGVYVDGANLFTPIPTGLPRVRTAKWEWDTIADRVLGCMSEGKNRPLY